MIKPPPVRQLPLVFDHEPATSRDDLIVSPSVHAAVAMIDKWPDWPSPVVVLAGPTGSGKSHLASIWAARTGACRVELTAPADDAVEAAARAPVLVEDVDRRAYDENALFHLINSVRTHGSSVLMTARRFPSGWKIALPDLASRLKAATVVEIGEPDEELLAQVMVKLFADRQVSVDDRIIHWLVARMERSLAAAHLIVDRLDQLALARGTKINRALAAEALARMDNGVSDIEPS
ncbi:MAG: DnaA regulatory inactivator HdaA [Hoeflea sp.]|uniref:DnaA regulatory inactivator HdaA n=1 Tax=Hoeflea sp. TaxID=1940281 RepID=UPI0032F051E7